MLVIISDLHLNDGSAAPENISPKAFAIWMKDVLALAQQNKAKELIFVYLGDMVDLLRTEHWFYPKPGAPLGTLGTQQAECFPLEHRPWGDREINQHPDQLSDVCRERARAILDKIRQAADKQLSYLRGDAADIKDEIAAMGIPVGRYYIPGNHDRLFWVDQAVQKGILDAFGACLPEGDRPFEVRMPEYGLVARHGHEWDPWNFENCDKDGRPQSADYKLVPIGDPITTELVARLPYQVVANLPASTPTVVREHVYEQLRHVEDVRPLCQALHWILTEPASLTAGYDQATQKAIVGAVDAAAKRIIADFMQIPFVKGWLAKHDKWNLAPDEADLLQEVHLLSKVLSIEKLDTALKWAEKLGLAKECDDSGPAAREVGAAPAARFCVYGHTHTFRHVPMGQDQAREDLVYFNSGTWRPRVALAKDNRSFGGFKEMTYLVFYRADEDLGSRESKGLSYELWNGIMKK